MAQTEAEKRSTITTVLFDFMGTCLDWHTVVMHSLPHDIPEEERSKFALDWRQDYFESNSARLQAGQPPEDIDVTLRNTLEVKLERLPGIKDYFTDVVKTNAIAAWHRQKAWDDVAPALERLRKRGFEIFVHANGTTRLQLDIVRSSGLRFDMLFSSEMLGIYKPAPENYLGVLKLIQRTPEECVTVAAHAYDLRGARTVGMKTVYIHRWTDDINEDMDVVKQENDAFLEDMNELDHVIANL